MRKYQIISKIGQGAKTKYSYYYLMAENKADAINKFRKINSNNSIIVQVKEVSLYV